MAYTQEDIAGMDYVKLCHWCGGAGEYEQTYTVGCGGGYYRAMGTCGLCSGIGLRSALLVSAPIPSSVIAQIDRRKALLANTT